MKLIIGEGFESGLERMFYRGCIGIFYKDTFGGLLTYIIAVGILILSIIGLITTIRFLIKRKRNKETPGQRWLRTGRID